MGELFFIVLIGVTCFGIGLKCWVNKCDKDELVNNEIVNNEIVNNENLVIGEDEKDDEVPPKYEDI